MEKVLDITDRLEDKRRKKQIETYRDKFEAVQRILQCSACHFKCSMCGRQMKGPELSNPPSPTLADSNLCKSCRSEFEDFLKISEEGQNGTNIFWHNKEWMGFWSSWLEHQKSMVRFRNSINFNRLTGRHDE